MRNYEAMFIFRSQLDEEKIDKEIKTVAKIIKDHGRGKVDYEILGKRTLAYRVQKQPEGYFVNYNFESSPSAIMKIKEDLKHRGNILRFIIFLNKEKRK